MSELNKGFEVSPFGFQSTCTCLGRQAVGSSFATMENKLNEVGRTAIRIGEPFPIANAAN